MTRILYWVIFIVLAPIWIPFLIIDKLMPNQVSKLKSWLWPKG